MAPCSESVDGAAAETASQFSVDSHATSQQHYQYTCLSCQVAFVTPELQREHMRTDWHRYNLKRKAADLPPVAADAFAQKLVEQQARAAQASLRAHAQQAHEYECGPCKKSFASENAYANHVASKKHRDMVARTGAVGESAADEKRQRATKTAQSTASVSTTHILQAPASVSETAQDQKSSQINWQRRLASAKTEDEVEAILQEKMASIKPLTEIECLFCTHAAESFDANLQHMSKEHSFFIPDSDCLTDAWGLIQYLGEKITVANVCIYCNGRGRAMHSVEAVRDHMVSKGHCKISYDDGQDEEYAEFYDFASDDGDEEWVDEDVEMSDEEWEDLGENQNESAQFGRRRARIADNQVQLVLPTGVRAGHRAFRTYWRQNIRADRAVPGSMGDPEMMRAITGSVGYAPSQAVVPGTASAVRDLMRMASGSGRQLSAVMKAARKVEVAARTHEGHRAAAVQYQQRTRVGVIGNNKKHFNDPNRFGG